jgi:uncharacterized protein (DUF58 family)
VGLVRFDDALRTMLPPRARRQQWRRVLAALADPGGGRGSDAPGALDQAARLIRRPGLVILVSDLLVDPAEAERALRRLRAGGHDVTVLHILDPAERDLTLAGDAIFVDPESGDEVPATIADVRDVYRATVRDALVEWRSRCAAAGASYETVVTDAPFGVPLRRAFGSRQHLPCTSSPPSSSPSASPPACRCCCISCGAGSARGWSSRPRATWCAPSRSTVVACGCATSR